MTAYDPAWLDRMYNNRALVANHAEHLERWARDSAAARADAKCVLDIPYGDSPGEKLDVFPADRPDAPVLVFIHGGYWRSLDKSDMSFVAPAFTRLGVCVVVPNYDLCPAVTIPQIVLQVVQAVAWTSRHIAAHGGDPRRITVAGHSAGGHLAAMMLACDWHAWASDLPDGLVTRALAISGLYDLDPLRYTPFLQPSLRLTSGDARRASPALFPPPPGTTLYAVVGGDESPEFLRQNALIRDAWGVGHVPVCEALPGHDHFSILGELVQPGQQLHRLALELLGEGD